MATIFKDRPWIWVIVAHLVIIALCVTVYHIAKKYGPKEIPLRPATHSSQAQQ
jgi:hypothetical protein